MEPDKPADKPATQGGPGLARALGATAQKVGKVLRRPRIGRGLRLPTRFHKAKPGAAAGIEPDDITRVAQPPAGAPPGPARITCIDYGPDRAESQHVTDFDAFLTQHRPAWATVRWINVDGLSDLRVIQGLAKKYELHPLAVEDVLHLGQRPKVEPYGSQGYASPDQPPCKDPHARLFIITRMIEMHGEGAERHLYSEQISMFLGHNTLLTIQETPGDIWDPIRARILTRGSRLRQNGAAFLAYALIDAIIDYCFPVLEFYGDKLEEIEDLVLDRPMRSTISNIHQLKRELLLLRRAVWPMREVVHTLQREPHECMDDTTRTYLRDVYDHTVQIIDIIETYREFASGLTETYMSSLSNRMNEIVKVLTIISTIFIPLTFLAGVYGMNFRHFPELDWWGSYPLFWTACAVIAGGMLIWFKRRRWLD